LKKLIYKQFKMRKMRKVSSSAVFVFEDLTVTGSSIKHFNIGESEWSLEW